MADLRKLKDKAAELAAKGKLEKAAVLYREAADADPKDTSTRQKLAEVLRRAGRTDEAVAAYQAVADRFAQDGLLIKAIAISKTLLELDPEHVETQSALAALYARRAAAEGARPPTRTMMTRAIRAAAPPASPSRPPTEDRVVALPLGGVAAAPEAPAAPEPSPDASGHLPLELVVEVEPQPPSVPTAYGEIVLAAVSATEAGVEEDVTLEVEPVEGAELEIAGDEPLTPVPAPSPPEALAPALPHVPIFSDLSRDAFVALTRAMALRRVSGGEAVVAEGEGGTTFYLVATGRLAVSRRDERGEAVVLARLGEGDFFGEMALLSGRARAASVTAEGPAELLEFRAEVLLELAGKHPHLAASLRRFYRQRLLANAMAVSPIFRQFGKGDRKLVMERFRARPIRAGETIVREGEPSDGLNVVLEGTLDVVKWKDGVPTVVARLQEGDLFGEMSCLRKAPASASVVARRGGTLLRLPRTDFDDLVMSYPQILELVSELSDERAESLDAILSGRAQWTEEGLVLV
jgi:CRP-like cAMP-binding protein